jgi:hypothetical protein
MQDFPLFEDFIDKRRIEALSRIEKIPIAALIWGPSPSATTGIAAARMKLRDELIKRGHLANFSEDLVDPDSSRSIFAQQIAQVEAYDIVFSIPASPGSVAEIHDFARIPWLSPKIITFLNNDWNDGYSNQSLVQLQSNATCRIQPYHPQDLPDCLIHPALELIQRLQEIYYIAGRRF